MRRISKYVAPAFAAALSVVGCSSDPGTQDDTSSSSDDLLAHEFLLRDQSGLCLTDGSGAPQTPLRMAGCNGNVIAQGFQHWPASDRVHPNRLAVTGGKKCVSAAASANPGTPVRVVTCVDRGPWDTWRMTDVVWTQTTTWSLIQLDQHPTACLTAGASVGAAATLQKCNAKDPRQLWALTTPQQPNPPPAPTPNSGGRYCGTCPGGTHIVAYHASFDRKCCVDPTCSVPNIVECEPDTGPSFNECCPDLDSCSECTAPGYHITRSFTNSACCNAPGGLCNQEDERLMITCTRN